MSDVQKALEAITNAMDKQSKRIDRNITIISANVVVFAIIVFFNALRICGILTRIIPNVVLLIILSVSVPAWIITFLLLRRHFKKDE